MAELYLLRHAQAGDRTLWTGDDHVRPLTKKGNRQAVALVQQFKQWSVTSILSSPYLRCKQTVEPLAQARGLHIETHLALAEGARDDDIRRLLQSAGDGTVLCTHGDVIGFLLYDLMAREIIEQGPFLAAKGSLWVLERTAGTITAARYVPAPA